MRSRWLCTHRRWRRHLAASLVAWDGDAPVGLLLVARRWTTARIAAMGVVAAMRGRGLGRVLLDAAVDQARARGERRMILRREGHATQLLRALRATFPHHALRVVPIVPQELLGELPARVGAELDPLTQLELARSL